MFIFFPTSTQNKNTVSKEEKSSPHRTIIHLKRDRDRESIWNTSATEELLALWNGSEKPAPSRPRLTGHDDDGPRHASARKSAWHIGAPSTCCYFYIIRQMLIIFTFWVIPLLWDVFPKHTALLPQTPGYSAHERRHLSSCPDENRAHSLSNSISLGTVNVHQSG